MLIGALNALHVQMLARSLVQLAVFGTLQITDYVSLNHHGVLLHLHARQDMFQAQRIQYRMASNETLVVMTEQKIPLLVIQACMK